MTPSSATNKENLVFPIALANLVLHGIDQPNLWHGNSLTRRATYAALFDQVPKTFDVILTNPPFGGKESRDAQKDFRGQRGQAFPQLCPPAATARQARGRQPLLVDGGFRRASRPSPHRDAAPARWAAHLKAAVVDVKEQLKRLKKDKASDADLSVLTARILEKDKTARELETRAADIDAAVFDLKAVNPTAAVDADTRAPQQIISNIEAQGRIVSEALAKLSALLAAARRPPDDDAPLAVRPSR
jgi:hypothetical protein